MIFYEPKPMFDDELFAMKVIQKSIMSNHNKVIVSWKHTNAFVILCFVIKLYPLSAPLNPHTQIHMNVAGSSSMHIERVIYFHWIVPFFQHLHFISGQLLCFSCKIYIFYPFKGMELFSQQLYYVTFYTFNIHIHGSTGLLTDGAFIYLFIISFTLLNNIKLLDHHVHKYQFSWLVKAVLRIFHCNNWTRYQKIQNS